MELVKYLYMTSAIFLITCNSIDANDDNGGSRDESSLSSSSSSENHGFDYANPKDWPKTSPVCGGKRQAPVNIILKDVKIQEERRPNLEHFGYDTLPMSMRLFNTGNTVKLFGEWPLNDKPTLYGGPLTGHYEFAQAHFHWGPSNDVGSEHMLDNYSFPLEMHMVHWKQSYGNLSEASKHEDGIAVLGLFMDLDRNNEGIAMMQKSFSNIQEPDQETEMEAFRLSSFELDILEQGYITYLGSLTTPPCSESVTWILPMNVKTVTDNELALFRELRLNHGDNHNYRPTQPLNGRTMYFMHNIRN